MQVLEILSLVIDEELVLEELLRTPGLISNAAACMTARSQELTLLVFALDSSLYQSRNMSLIARAMLLSGLQVPDGHVLGVA